MADQPGEVHPFGPELTVETHGAVRLVVLDRPESLNAVNSPLHRALCNVWHFLGKDSAARAVILTGRGRAFSAGGDLDHVTDLQRDRQLRRTDVEEARSIVAQMIDFPLPVIAAVNGPAVGFGCNLALGADLVYIAESAYLADPHVRIGLTAGDGGAALWPLLASMIHAKEYLFTGDKIPAGEAVRMGLATRAFPDADLMAGAIAMANRLAALPPQALESTKRACNMHLRNGVLDVLEYALAREFETFDTAEHQTIIRRMRSNLLRAGARTE